MKSITLFIQWIFVAYLSASSVLAQVNNDVRVILTDGPGRDIVALLESNASIVMSSINRFNPTIGRVVLPDNIKAGEGIFGQERLSELIRETGIRVTSPELRSQVIMLNNNTYEIRRMYVTTDAENDRQSLELILSFNAEGRLTDTRFAIAEHQFNTILESAKSLEEDYYLRQIINYIEQIKTAYNRKDADYIELQFSDKALIITGTRIQEFEGESNMVRASDNEVVREKFRLNKQTKAEYMSRLRDVIFKNNEFINVDFSGINIYVHPDYEKIYWVQVFQKWSSSTYSDEGYLSFMIDFGNEDQPLIYVRAWQPEPFSDGTLIDLNMFEIIK
jgi:hypothetical protein